MRSLLVLDVDVTLEEIGVNGLLLLPSLSNDWIRDTNLALDVLLDDVPAECETWCSRPTLLCCKIYNIASAGKSEF